MSQVYKGVKSIPIENIKGSEGRYKDFDKHFLPKQSSTKSRWINVGAAHYKNIELPAIQVYKIGDVYFVRDGNHRVSVAKEKGKKYIDAEIIELKSKVPLEKDIDYEQLVLKEEYLRFIEKTNVDKLIPGERFEISRAGRHDILLEQIKGHQQLLSSLSGKKVGWEEAVQSWYKTIYFPVISMIKKHHIMKHFHNLYITDLYVWIIGHWNYLKERYDTTVKSEEAAIDLKEKYSEKLLYRWIKRIKGIFKKKPGHHSSR
ncbi:MAG: transcriptional regulator, partial [Spirochaetes bacterium]|nr:transcriptional regulator [Spirochaetota bacterium]